MHAKNSVPPVTLKSLRLLHLPVLVWLVVSIVFALALTALGRAQNAEAYVLTPTQTKLLAEKYAAYIKASREWEEAKQTVVEKALKPSRLGQTNSEQWDFTPDFRVLVPSSTFRISNGTAWGDTITLTPCPPIYPGSTTFTSPPAQSVTLTGR